MQKKLLQTMIFLLVCLFAMFPIEALGKTTATDTASPKTLSAFLTDKASQDYFVLSGRVNEISDRIKQGDTLRDLGDLMCEANMSIQGSAIILTPKVPNEYMMFAVSNYFVDALIAQGGDTVRYKAPDIMISVPIGQNPSKENYIIVAEAPVQPKKTIGHAWQIDANAIGASGSTVQTFSLRLPLDQKYKLSQLSFVKYDASGKTVLVKTTLKISHIGAQYYVNTGLLQSGVYAIVKK